MSRVTIDLLTYRSMLSTCIAKLIDQGLDLRAARAMAQDHMDACFIPDQVVDLREAQLDANDEAQGDWTR